MSSEKVGFAGSSQGLLVGVLERPDHAPLQALAVFAHCFTCGKNSLAATRISRALAQQGIATLRFDFTGLGESEGDFGRGGFSSSVADIVAAVHWMQSTIGMPALLVGHSLGGTAAIAAAARLDGIRAVCTLGAPATADHVLRHFGPTKSEEDGQIQVDLGGRAFRIAPAFIEELQAQAHENPVKGLRAALLVMHAPSDAVVDIGEAHDLFKAARHPKSFISLDDADHLHTRPADAQYAADLIGAWASRFLPMRAERNDAPSDLRAGEVWVGEHDHAFWRSMRAGPHHLDADEPKEVGGGERGPDPKDAFRNELRRVLNRGEAVNALKRAIYTGRISPAQAKRVDEMQAVADALSLMANIVMAWNTSQMQAVLDRWSNRRQVIPPELIGKIAPTRLESINLRGVFRFPVDRYADQILPSRPNASITGTNG